MNETTKKSLLHGVKVFLYAGISALVPGLIAYLSNDARYLVLVPVVNAMWAGIQKYVTEHNLLAGKK